MNDLYGIQSFPTDYCQKDVQKITTAVKSRASLLVIGMPGCGKSRLMDFIFTRPDVLQKYGFPHQLKFIRVDADAITTHPIDMYVRLLRALNPELKTYADGSINVLKEQLIAEISTLAEDTNLVVSFDNFNQPLQEVLGKDFFNFLYALRNSRPKLNASYIFLANLKINKFGFYKIERLFDQGIERSTCWLSLLNRQDALFSIERQWAKAGYAPDTLDNDHKEKIYEWSGGHALMNRYLSHQMLEGEITMLSTPGELLSHASLHRVCDDIWQDLDQNLRNILIDLAYNHSSTKINLPITQLLQNYGVLTSSYHFFSPIFEKFGQQQQKSEEKIATVHCNETKTRLIFKTTVNQEITYPLDKLSSRKKSLLCYLVENSGETCTKDKLKDVGWPSDEQYAVSDQSLSRQIDELKRWLGDLNTWLKTEKLLGSSMDIKTQWGSGYKLDVKE